METNTIHATQEHQQSQKHHQGAGETQLLAPEEPVQVHGKEISSLGRYVFGSEISYNKPPPRLPGLGC
jgi:hypothetical protein